MRRLDPRIHDAPQLRRALQLTCSLRGLMDCRVRPGNDRGRGGTLNYSYSPADRLFLSTRASHSPSASKPAPDITKTGTALNRSKIGALIATPSVCPK